MSEPVDSRAVGDRGSIPNCVTARILKPAAASIMLDADDSLPIDACPASGRTHLRFDDVEVPEPVPPYTVPAHAITANRALDSRQAELALPSPIAFPVD